VFPRGRLTQRFVIGAFLLLSGTEVAAGQKPSCQKQEPQAQFSFDSIRVQTCKEDGCLAEPRVRHGQRFWIAFILRPLESGHIEAQYTILSEEGDKIAQEGRGWDMAPSADTATHLFTVPPIRLKEGEHERHFQIKASVNVGGVTLRKRTYFTVHR
jgi:hypothetical protein